MRKLVVWVLFCALFCSFAFSSCDCKGGDRVFKGFGKYEISSWPTGLAFSPDGDTLAVATDNGSVTFLDLSGDDLAGSVVSSLTDEPLAGVSYSEDGATYAIADTIRIYRVAVSDNTPVEVLDYVEGVPERNAGKVSVSPAGAMLVYFDKMHDNVHPWDLGFGKKLPRRFVAEFTNIDYARDIDRLYIGMPSGDVVMSKKSSSSTDSAPAHDPGPAIVACPQDGSYVATGGGDWNVKIWSPDFAEEKNSFPVAARPTSIAASAELLVVATARTERLFAWEMPSGKLVVQEFLDGEPRFVAVSRDGKKIACVVGNRFVWVFVRE